MATKRAFSGPIQSLPRLFRATVPNRVCAALAPQHQTSTSLRIIQPVIPARLAHNIPRPRNYAPIRDDNPSSDQQQPSDQQSSSQPNRPIPNIRQQPYYELTFTCKPCGERSRHRVSKQGYHYGSVLIACPKCRNRHVISDHLRIFGDTARTVEDILRERGELVKKGTLGEDGDIEFWEDGTATPRTPFPEPERKPVVEDDKPPGWSFKSAKVGENSEVGKTE